MGWEREGVGGGRMDVRGRVFELRGWMKVRRRVENGVGWK